MQNYQKKKSDFDIYNYCDFSEKRRKKKAKLV